jgi:pimeloyl-ACP methyl ester carboxylesterase
MAPYAIEREFEDIAAVIDGIGGPVDLVGHSYGAICSLEGAARAKNLRRMVLYEPPIQAGIQIYVPGLIERLESLLAAGERDEVVTTFMREGPKVPPDQLALMRSKPAWKARVAAAHTIPRELRGQAGYVFRPEDFKNLPTPTLFLLGGDSPTFFKAALDLAQPAVAGSRLAVLPGQQHTAMDTGPALFLNAVLEFLAP